MMIGGMQACTRGACAELLLTTPMNAVATPVEMAVAATMLSEGMPVLAPAEAPERMSGLRNRM